MLGSFDFDVIQRTWQHLIFEGLLFTVKLTLVVMPPSIATSPTAHREAETAKAHRG